MGLKKISQSLSSCNWQIYTQFIKKKGSRLDMNNDRGIFILSVLRKILDMLIYYDKYPGVAESMSDSNVGAQREKNTKNHLFVIHGIIKSVINGGAECIDLQIYDIVQCFDALWLEDCTIDIYTSSKIKDDKLSLMYNLNKINYVAVNTPLGQTSRFEVKNTVMQGSTPGPLLCSNSVDTLGRKSILQDENLYMYKNRVKVPVLGCVDDLLGVAKCGKDSLYLNIFINTQIELEKLKFHTPDKTGKTKYHILHIGDTSKPCPELKVHNSKMKTVKVDSYLGDRIDCTGSNKSNIESRISKGIGMVTQTFWKLFPLVNITLK